MDTTSQAFYIPPMGDSLEQVSKYETASPWLDYPVGFNIQNHNYPVMHTHEYYEILVILSGTILHKINDMQYVMTRGDCCLIRPDDRHCVLYPETDPAPSDFLCANFMFKSNFFDQITGIYPVTPFPTVEENKTPLSFSISSSYIDSIQETCLHIQTPLNDPTPQNVTVCEALISELLHTCVRIRQFQPEYSFPAWMQKLILTMQNPDNFNKSIKDMIVDIPYSYSHIQKQFKRLTGVSLVVHFNSLKLAHAKDLLASTKMSVSDISTFLGFDSTSHFNHLFKREFKISPTQYRKIVNTTETKQTEKRL